MGNCRREYCIKLYLYISLNCTLVEVLSSRQLLVFKYFTLKLFLSAVLELMNLITAPLEY